MSALGIFIECTLLLALTTLLSLPGPRRSASRGHTIWSMGFLTVLAVTAVSLAGSLFLSSEAPQPEAWLSTGWGLVWTTGAAASLVRGLIAWALVRHRVRAARPPETPAWGAILDDLTERMKLPRLAKVRVSLSRISPTVSGLVRPVVLLPADAATWNRKEFRTALAHELNHTSAWSRLADLAVELTSILHWYHPWVWYGIRRFRIERARAADDAAIAALPDATGYEEYLLTRAGVSTSGRSLASPLAQTQPSDLEARLLNVMDDQRRISTTSPAARWYATCAALLVSVPLGLFPFSGIGDREAETLLTAGSEGLPSVDIQGTLRVSGSDAPIAGADVLLAPLLRPEPEPPPDARIEWRVYLAADRSREPYRSESDGAGRFVGTDIKPGAYQLVVAAEGFMQIPSTAGRTIVTVRPDGTMEPETIRMLSTSTVSGQVRDADGRPIPYAIVRPYKVVQRRVRSYLDNAPYAGAGRLVRTNADGQYQIALAAGEYYLATYPLFLADPRQGIAEIPEDVAPLGRIYYPGEYRPQDASPVRVRAGEDLHDVDIRYPAGELSRIRLRVIFDPDAVQTPPRRIHMRPDPNSLTNTGAFEDAPSGSAQWETLSDGTGLSPLVPADTYELRVFVPTSDGTDLLTSESRLTIDGADLLYDTPLRPPVTLHGSVVAGGDDAPEIDYTQILLTSRFQWFPDDATIHDPGIVAPNLDGSFQLSVPHGPSTLWVRSLPPNFYLASATIDGIDYLDQGIEIDQEVTGPVELTIRPGAGIITGTVRNEDGDRLTGARVTLIDFLERRGGKGGILFDYTDVDGRFWIGSVPPGSYRVLAVANEMFAYPTDSVLGTIAPELPQVTAVPGEIVSTDAILADSLLEQ